jgi:hypothetical protein
MRQYKKVAEITIEQRQSLPSEYPVAMPAGVAALLGVMLSITGSMFSFSPDQQFLGPVPQALFSLGMIVLFAVPTSIISYMVTAMRLKKNPAIKAVVEGYGTATGSYLSNFQALRLLHKRESKLPERRVLRVVEAEGESERVILTYSGI